MDARQTVMGADACRMSERRGVAEEAARAANEDEGKRRRMKKTTSFLSLATRRQRGREG